MNEIIPNFTLSKNRYLELKYHCLQYHNWEDIASGNPIALHRAYVNKYEVKIAIIDTNCDYPDILMDCVTAGLTYKKLKDKYGAKMPSKEEFSNAYRAFFYFLDKRVGI